MTDLYPMLITPRYVERLWGGHNLTERLGKAAPRDQAIGESWEIYEENTVANGRFAGRTVGQLRAEMGRDLTGRVASDQLFPLLTKLIDAQDVLSVQVHPNDTFAREKEGQPYGKTECWYVIDVAPGAQLTYGLNRDSSPEEYTRLVRQGKLDGILRSISVRPGDVIYLPAGMVHAIGAGIVLYEVQQTSDLTYRIYDWNRTDAAGKPRELHVEKARQVLDYHRCTRGAVHTLTKPGSGRTMLVAGQYFCNELIQAGVAGELPTYNSPVAICALDQPLAVHTTPGGDPVSLAPYSSLLIPAAAGGFALQPVPQATGAARAVITYVPASSETVHTDLALRGFSATEVNLFLAQFAPATNLGQAAQ